MMKPLCPNRNPLPALSPPSPLLHPLRAANLTAAFFLFSGVAALFAQQTIGGGTLASPAQGPAASFGLGEGATLVKNWDFGTNGTIKTMADMDAEFHYRDQNSSINNSNKYGSLTVASGTSTAMINPPPKGRTYQPLDNNPANPVRVFGAGTLKTHLVLLAERNVVSKDQYGSTTVSSFTPTVGNGSFMAKYETPRGGSLLGHDVIWETRVRMDVPPSFWFAIWTAGQNWAAGAEFDLVESFGKYGGTNDDIWHSATVSGYGPNDTTRSNSWGEGMAARGVPAVSHYRGDDWHVWTMVYRADNTVSVYLDGIEVQDGLSLWTRAGTPNDNHLVINYLFDGSWGHVQVPGMDGTGTPATALIDKFYEWDYSRIYLRPTDNLAWGKPVTASSAAEPASNAVDGDFRTTWKTSAADNQWMTVDLGQNYSLGRMVLHWDYSGVTRGGQPIAPGGNGHDANYAPNDPDYASSFRVEVSSDGSLWTQVHNETSSAGGMRRIFFATPVTGRFVRLTNLTRSTAAGATLNEIEIYPHHGIAGTENPAQALPIAGATATNTQGSDIPAHSFDGNDSTLWRGKGTINAWIQWDLGGVQTVEQVRIKFENWREYDFALQVSTNGQHWNTVLATQKGLKANGTWQIFRFNKPAGTRFVRYLTYGSDVDDFTKIKEVQIMGWEGDLLGGGMEGDLFYDDFASGAGAWSLGTTPPWSIILDAGDSTYNHTHTSLASAVNLAGSHWENYEAALDVKFTQMDSWSATSFYSSYTDSQNYYRLALQYDSTHTSMRLYKKISGVETQIAAAYPTLAPDAWHTVRLAKDGSHLTVKLNGMTYLDLSDATPLPAGKIGLNAKKQAVRFDNVTVTSASAVAGINLALNAPTLASTNTSTSSRINDGDAATRWSSTYADNQWIHMDLGQTRAINRVVLKWETAYASGYRIEVSNDAATWTPIYTTTTGTGGIEDLTLAGSGRYVRLYCVQRATGWGNSLWEMEVHGLP